MNFTRATRQNVPLLIGIAGPSGAGKTFSALRLAKGIAGDGPIAAIDTERGRMLHYADEFSFLHGELDAPFSPERYAEAIQSALALNPAVIIVDSFTHEWAGEGGVLDMQEAELERMAGGDWRKREAVRFASWIKPKSAHKALVNDVLLRLPCHLIVCLRAEDKVEMVKDPKTGRQEVVPKRTLAGHVGWIPICGKDLPYELTISLVVTPDAPGVPHPIKLQSQHRPFVPLDTPLTEDVGRALAEWARGSGAAAPASTPPSEAGTPSPSAVPDTFAGEPGGDPLGATDGARSADSVRSESSPAMISPAQRRRLFAIAKEHGVREEHLRDLLVELTGSESTAELTIPHYESLVSLIESREAVTA